MTKKSKIQESTIKSLEDKLNETSNTLADIKRELKNKTEENSELNIKLEDLKIAVEKYKKQLELSDEACRFLNKKLNDKQSTLGTFMNSDKSCSNNLELNTTKNIGNNYSENNSQFNSLHLNNKINSNTLNYGVNNSNFTNSNQFLVSNHKDLNNNDNESVKPYTNFTGKLKENLTLKEEKNNILIKESKDLQNNKDFRMKNISTNQSQSKESIINNKYGGLSSTVKVNNVSNQNSNFNSYYNSSYSQSKNNTNTNFYHDIHQKTSYTMNDEEEEYPKNSY